MTEQKFNIGDIVTRNEVKIPGESIYDLFAGFEKAMVSRMPAKVTKTLEIDGGQSVYLNIPEFETIAFNSLYLRIAEKFELK